MRSFSSRPRRSPARAISFSPAPMTIPKPCAPYRQLGFAKPAVGVRAGAKLAPRQTACDPQPAGARNPDRARSRAAADIRRNSASRCGAAALRPVPVAPPGGRAALLAVSRQSRASGARRRDHGGGSAAGRAPGATPRSPRFGADRKAFSRRYRTVPASPPNSIRSWRVRGISRIPSIGCGAGPAKDGFRSGSSCCAAPSTARRPGAALADIAETALAALLPAGGGRVRAPARPGAGRQFRGDRDGSPRQPRDDPRLRSGSDPDL